MDVLFVDILEEPANMIASQPGMGGGGGGVTWDSLIFV
jgi:hypothetical protein